MVDFNPATTRPPHHAEAWQRILDYSDEQYLGFQPISSQYWPIPGHKVALASTLVTKSRCFIAVPCTWLLSLSIGVYRTFIKGSSDLPKFYIAANVLDFALTFAITSCCHFLIFKQARRHKRKIMAENTSQVENLTVVSENKAAVTVAMVIGAYGLTQIRVSGCSTSNVNYWLRFLLFRALRPLDCDSSLHKPSLGSFDLRI